MSRPGCTRLAIDAGHARSYFQERGVSLKTLASYLDVDERSVRRVLSQGWISLEMALDVCEFLDEGFGDVFGRDEGDDVASLRERMFRYF